MDNERIRTLKILSKEYPDISSASAGVIRLKAALELPKETEHFISDIHGEYEAFFHVVKNGSGAVRRKIGDALGDSVTEAQKNELATIIYYPKEKLEHINRLGGLGDEEYKDTISNLILVCRKAMAKYPQRVIREAIPPEYAEIFEELLDAESVTVDKKNYINALLDGIVSVGRADDFIKAVSLLIRKMTVARLHIVGDIYDRGPGPHFIMDFLSDYHAYDVQWGNHDVVWMGASLGHAACICNVLRGSLRYDALDIINEGYGINTDPLAAFALKHYKDDPCECYAIKGREITYDEETQLTMKMHKAISVIQWKMEGRVILENPEFGMDDRLILEKINYENGTLCQDGREIPLKDTEYPTVDPAAPYELTDEEKELMDYLEIAFKSCGKLKQHATMLVRNGGLYLKYNGNLMFHACVPLNEDGTLKEVNVYGEKFKGKKLFDRLEGLVRKGFTSDKFSDIIKAGDILWFLWNSPGSPLFGKAKMATFERYITDDKEAKKEKKNPYYGLVRDPGSAEMILKEFGLDPENGVIINGHVPVKQCDGENPVKADGKVFMIDGGFSRAYQKETGIAGYTLIYNSLGKYIVAHRAFTSAEDAIKNGYDIISDNVYSVTESKRVYVKDTDRGREIEEEIKDLSDLIDAYKNGDIKER